MSIKVHSIGNTGAETTVTTFANGGMKVTFPLASSDTWTDNVTNEKRTSTEWVQCQATGKLADEIQHMPKGSFIEIEGALKTDNWTDQNGKKHSRMYVQLFSVKDAIKPKAQTPAPVAEKPTPAKVKETVKKATKAKKVTA